MSMDLLRDVATARRSVLERMNQLLVVHAAATWFMVGLIWTIQVLHYPLFLKVGIREFVSYEQAHTKRTGALLAIPATIEVLTAGALVWLRPADVGLALVLVAGTLLAAIWVMTALVQVPLHRRLVASHDRAVIRSLVASNWWRTGAWSLRGLLVAWMLLL